MAKRTFEVLSIFPKMFEPVLSESIIKRAQEKKLVKINLYDLRDFTPDKHKKVDAPPYGGGPGMVFRVEPVYYALEHIKKRDKKTKPWVILLSPQGKILTQKLAKKILRHKRIVLLCGRYEGVDERIREYLIDEEISIGDYILTGGEIPAMVLLDVLTRLIPGAVGDAESIRNESFENGFLDFPHYTRPRNFKGWKVPSILLSGDHKKIEKWRRQKAKENTLRKRPDLLS